MNTFIDLTSDIVVPGPRIPFADSRPLIAPPPFEDAVDHWRFARTAGSRLGLVNGLPMRRGIAVRNLTGGTGYTSRPVVTLAGDGAAGLTASAEIQNGAVVSVLISGQPVDDTAAVTATISGGGGTGATVTFSRGIEPTYYDTNAVTAAGRENGLITSIDDRAVYSEAYLIRRPASAAVQRIGGTASSPTYGRGVAVAGDGFSWHSSNRIEHLSGGIANHLDIPASWIPGRWGVLVISQAANARLLRAFGPDGSATSLALASGKVIADPMRKRAIGGVHWDFSSDNPYKALEISSYVNWSFALGDAQLENCAFDMLDAARDAGLI
jgi:hypothetical protein